MIFEAIFEEAYQAALKYKKIVERSLGDSPQGIELYGRARAFSDFFTNQKLDETYKKYLAETGRKNK